MSSRATRRLTIFIAHPSQLLTDHRAHGDGLVSFGFIKRLAERGHELHVAAQCVDLRVTLPPHVHVYELMPKYHLSVVERLTLMRRMRALFRRLSRDVTFDVIHQMNPVVTGLSLSFIGLRTPLILGTFVPKWQNEDDEQGKRRVWVAHIKRSLLRMVARLQQAQAAGLLIASPDAISRIPRPDRHQGRIYEVRHGIDIERFGERTAVPARPTVLFLAHVVYKKGIFTLLDAFEQVARAVPDVELVIAGPGRQLDEVRERVATMTGSRIRIHGPVDRADVPALMRQHSVYCLPSYGEPFATSILEAMACGVPVVATNAGGIPHLVSETGGRLVAPRDAPGLAAALIEVLTSPDLQRSMGRHNRQRLEGEFEIEKTVDRLEAAYDSVLRRSALAGSTRGRSEGNGVDVMRRRLSGTANRDS